MTQIPYAMLIGDENLSNYFVFIDFETTGLEAEHDRVIEIGAIRYDFDGKELGMFEQLVNPGVEIPQFIQNLTGIDTDTVRLHGEISDTAFTRLLEFIGNDTLVAFNAEFDKAFLHAEVLRAGLVPPKQEWMCALGTSRRAWPIFRRHSLSTLAKFFSLAEQSHRALEDCRIGARLFLTSLTVIGQDKISTEITLGNLCITLIDIDALYECKSEDELTLWTKDDFSRINAYAPNKIFGQGLVLSMEKSNNKWLVEQMRIGKVTKLKVLMDDSPGYEIIPVFSGV